MRIFMCSGVIPAQGEGSGVSSSIHMVPAAEDVSGLDIRKPLGNYNK